jgi:hypothetical protein
MKIKMVKTLEGLQATDAEGQLALSKIGEGEVVQVEVTQPRNSQFHRRFFALLNLVFDNQERYQSHGELLDALKFGIGHCDTFMQSGVQYAFPKSISYAEMTSEEFQDFYNRAVHWVCSVVIPEMDKDNLEEAVREELLGFGD